MQDPLLHEIVQTIVSYCNPQGIWLYGSYAKGQARLASDIDLLVVRDSPLTRGQRALEIRQLFYDFPLRVDLVVLTPEEIAEELGRRYSFTSSIMKSAVELYSRHG